MSAQENPNYPDLLGAITGGIRLNLDVIQCALAMRPTQVPAGHFCELIVLIQNASDIDVDITVCPVLPDTDREKKKGVFIAKNSRLLIGLRPAEVGYLVLPIATSPKTSPAQDYLAGVTLDIKRLSKKPQRIRETVGGGPFLLQELPQETQHQMPDLRTLRFGVDHAGKKNYVQTTFDVLPPALARLQELKANWISLWTMRDYLDEYIIAQKVWEPAMGVVKKLTRENVFMPLLKTTQTRFEACGYPIKAPEAIYITKLLTLVLEMGVTVPDAADPHPAWPRWFIKLVRLLLQEPALAAQFEPLLTRLLYGDLVYDSIMYGFTMVSTVTGEEFGTVAELSHYADDIVEALAQGKPLDFARTYFPLVLAGLIANTRVTMPREQVRETVHILSKAVETRQPEKNGDNGFIFDLADKLIERAFDMTS